MARTPPRHIVFGVAVVLASGGLPAATAGQVCGWSETLKITASDAAPGDEYGYPVAIWGDYLVIGAWHDDDHGSNSGSAYVYDRHSGAELFKLTADDASQGAQFGYPITISNGVAIIGAVSDSQRGHEAGAAYLFDVETGAQRRKLTASDARPDDWFGVSVANSGSRAIVGANQTDDHGSNSGSAYIFDSDTGEELFRLTASDAGAGDWFGFDVEIDEAYAIVGARRSDAAGLNAGAAYVFDVSTGAQLLRLTAADARTGAEFGRSLAVSGHFALIGANLDNHAGIASGAAYVFDITTGEQLAKLKPHDPGYMHLFGIRVAIEHQTVLVGAWFDRHAGTGSGSAYVFELDCPCPPDLNMDGVLNFFDVQRFLNAYSVHNNLADWNDDGSFNFFDVQLYLRDLSAGCG